MPAGWYDPERERSWANPSQQGRDKRRYDDFRADHEGLGMTAHPDTHPTIRKLMEPYYKQFDKISGNMICNAAGIHINDLNLRGACLHHILGGCVGSCGRQHPHSSKANPE